MRAVVSLRIRLGLLAALSLVAACGDRQEQAVRVAVLDSDSAPQRAIRAATVEGLVAVDHEGQIVPALADRWIVTEDGQSYIFRLRDGTWADGSPLTGETARTALRQALASLRGSPLRLDLAAIEEVRAMAGRVVELRLTRPMPDLLQLLAQPELGLAYRGQGAGPMALRRDGDAVILTPIPPEGRGLPAVKNWAQSARPVRLLTVPADRAVALFAKGDLDAVLGGTFAEWPAVLSSSLPGQAIRVDPVAGLFGLAVLHQDGFLAEAENREAIAMAIDREALAAAMRAPGWAPTTRIVSPATPGDADLVAERWADIAVPQRQAIAASRVARWRARRGEVVLRIALSTGPGADRLFSRLATDLAAAGFKVQRVGAEAAADLQVIDAVAPYSRPDWFFLQLGCKARPAACSPAADARYAEALAIIEPAGRSQALAEAEAQLAADNVFVPLGPPLRWSLASPGLAGLTPNRWALHPLLALAVAVDK